MADLSFIKIGTARNPTGQKLDPDKMKIGYIILVAGGKTTVEKLQRRIGYKEHSKWTHAMGSLGGYDAIEAVLPRSRVINLQRTYVKTGYEIKVLKRKNQPDHQRYKIALWWATLNNLPYDTLQFFYFPLLLFSKFGSLIHFLCRGKKMFVCSELIAHGFYKEGDSLFNKPLQNILPADFDNMELFEEVTDIWQ